MTKARIRKLLKEHRRNDDKVTALYAAGAMYLGEGCFRTAYRLGDYVVKPCGEQSTQIGREHRQWAAHFGIGFVRTERVGRWQIQRFCARVPKRRLDRLMVRMDRNKAYTNSCVDFNDTNLGLDARGRVVAYDW